MPEPPRGGKEPDEYTAGEARLSFTDPPEAGPRRPLAWGAEVGEEVCWTTAFSTEFVDVRRPDVQIY